MKLQPRSKRAEWWKVTYVNR